MSNKKNNNSFIYRFKNDSKYNAKVQLMGFVIFVVIIVIYLNISRIGDNYDYNNVINKIDNKSNDEVVSIFDKINDNYTYNISISAKSKDKDVTIIYSGKRYEDNTIINRNSSGVNDVFYKISDEYYINGDNNYKYIDEDIVYEFVANKYIELDGVMNLINKASLDHLSNESNGEINYLYKLAIKDVVLSYSGSDIIDIKVNVFGDVLTIDIDYTNLFKEVYDDIDEYLIKYVFTDIDKVEKFVIIDDKKKEN